jgi:hypothetical protein
MDHAPWCEVDLGQAVTLCGSITVGIGVLHGKKGPEPENGLLEEKIPQER